ncbi:type I secretion system permease/ATPase [Donghicola sp. C2-DW-16]|uniref:Type I secretion system permease/ATPase n=1 Tax=Donghicola mangrovi TaxID=2729614 RepID=A0A850PZY3_9RHOB|nr:type I secretion system permease/ATPase [Donghicola mangrovi]NVO22343.1 type I secretion system permease/ATPase [Donghicola mangrovi]NVO26066.1 type I secretion system permease/ATPase [Donghicola mangrovi]
MAQPRPASGRDELIRTRREFRPLFWAVGIFSFFANILMLTGPMYMLLVYDRVLGSRSEATLLALTLLVVFLFVMMGVLDVVRGRIMARIGAKFQNRLERRVYDASLRRAALDPNASNAQTGLRDLESVQRMLASPGLMAIFDLPWTPFFLASIMVFHFSLGVLALGGGAILVVLALTNQQMARRPLLKSMETSQRAELMGDQLRNEAEMLQALGMRGSSFNRWIKTRSEALEQSVAANDISGTFSSATKTFRLLLQSAMLGLGAYLVLLGHMTGGSMIAGSILMGRALAPIEMAIGQWPVVQRGLKGWTNLAELLSTVPPEAPRTPLPRPKAVLSVNQLTIIPPGEKQAALRMVSFDLLPGQAVGVVGPSGAGKSTLARALTGIWRPAGGKVRLDGASLDQYDPDVLGQLIGYLPQRVTLFDGTITENIARLSETPDPEQVVLAAKRAAAHDMILKLPDGYDTRVSQLGGRLSGGQIQRIGLARALYGDPVILVLDEPNSNLDNEGSEAVNAAIRRMKAEGKAALIMAHRPAAIQECDLILMLEGGGRREFGPKDEVLRKILQNHRDVAAARPGGVS